VKGGGAFDPWMALLALVAAVATLTRSRLLGS
jgi:hypothetical protein